MSDETQIGTVKWFSEKKGYGFIVGEDGKDYFFHYSEILAIDLGDFLSLAKGAKVKFKPMDSGKGPRATDIEEIG